MVSLRTTSIVWITAASLASAQETTKRGYLGVITTPTVDGELVTSVDAQGPAAAAGVKVGHTLLRLDAQPLTSQNSLRAQMQSKKAAQVVTITIRDGAGKVEDKTVTLRERPTISTFPRSNYRRPGDDDDWTEVPGFNDLINQTQFLQPGPRPMLGVTVIDPDPRLREQLKLGDVKGALISEVRPNTPAFDAKLQANDFVTAINDQPLNATIDLQRIISTTKADSQVKLKILRDGKPMDVMVTVKTMTAPGIGGMSGLPPMGMGTAPNADLVNQINELKQRVATLEARIQTLEQRLGAQPGVPGTLKTPPQPAPTRPRTNP